MAKKKNRDFLSYNNEKKGFCEFFSGRTFKCKDKLASYTYNSLSQVYINSFPTTATGGREFESSMAAALRQYRATVLRAFAKIILLDDDRQITFSFI